LFSASLANIPEKKKNVLGKIFAAAPAAMSAAMNAAMNAESNHKMHVSLLSIQSIPLDKTSQKSTQRSSFSTREMKAATTAT
jgi:hypothetical protein